MTKPDEAADECRKAFEEWARRNNVVPCDTGFMTWQAAKAEQPTTDRVVDWAEDAAHENGNYGCRCTKCGVSFKGDKRRVLCQSCALPPCPEIDPIRKLACEVGYAIGEHGSKVRDYDLMAAPWSEDAVDAKALVEHLCRGLNARVVDEGAKPHGRYVYIIQLRDRWLKHIDLSILPRAPVRESVNLSEAHALDIVVRHLPDGGIMSKNDRWNPTARAIVRDLIKAGVTLRNSVDESVYGIEGGASNDA